MLLELEFTELALSLCKKDVLVFGVLLLLSLLFVFKCFLYLKCDWYVVIYEPQIEGLKYWFWHI